MKCKNFSGQPFTYAQKKRDGNWLAVGKLPDGTPYMQTRLPTNLIGKLWWMDAYRLCKQMPSGVCLWGELWLPGSKASDVKTAINDRNSNLRFDVFACPTIDHAAGLPEVESYVKGLGFDFVEYRHDGFLGDYENWWRLDKDCEGLVLKEANCQGWYKLKDIKTIDCVITGFKDGRGKYLGLTGALLVSVWDGTDWVEVANVGGMNDVARITISADEDEYLGKVVEVEYQYVGNKGRLRHPRFKRFRDDKPRTDCTIDQDEDLITCRS